MRLTRRSLLLSAASATFVPRSLAASDSRAPRFLVVVFATGGWDVTFALDPKPRVEGGPIDGPWVDESGEPGDVEELRVIHGIPVQCNDFKRPSVTTFFETHGAQACVINGIWTGSIVHQPSRIRLLTGTQDAERPDFATIVGASRGASVDLPLGSIDFSGLGYVGELAASTGRIGHSSQLVTLLDPDKATFPAPSWADYTLPLFRPSTDQEAAIQEHLARRMATFRGQHTGQPHDLALLDDMAESLERRKRLLERADLIVGRLSAGGIPSLDLQASVAIDLLVGGVCHAVMLADGDDSWDTHDNNEAQHGHHEALFASLQKLMDSLQLQGIAQDTLVVVMSEMTRTPRLNYKLGKDHWAHTSQLWLGAGVRGGAVVGGTSELLESLPVDLATGEISATHGSLNKYDNVVAGILAHMGVEPERYLPGVAPFRGASL
jgi:hypothetical protein